MMSQVYTSQRRVEFRDTDAAGMVHFSVFFTYMEQAEHEMLRALGTSVVVKNADGLLSWPRVAASCQYHLPARFEDLLDVEVHIRRIGTKSITYAARFLRGDQLLADGELTVVCCRMEPDGSHHATPIPDDCRQRLTAYVAST